MRGRFFLKDKLSTGGQTINTFADKFCVMHWCHAMFFFQNLFVMVTVATSEASLEKSMLRWSCKARMCNGQKWVSPACRSQSEFPVEVYYVPSVSSANVKLLLHLSFLFLTVSRIIIKNNAQV